MEADITKITSATELFVNTTRSITTNTKIQTLTEIVVIVAVLLQIVLGSNIYIYIYIGCYIYSQACQTYFITYKSSLKEPQSYLLHPSVSLQEV